LKYRTISNNTFRHYFALFSCYKYTKF